MESDASKLAALFDDLPIGIFVRSTDGRIEWMNRAALSLLHADEGAVGHHCGELLRCRHCGPHCAAYLANEDREIRTGFPVAVERSDGTKRLLLIDAIPMKRGRVAVVMHDVTDLRACDPVLESRQIRFLLGAANPKG